MENKNVVVLGSLNYDLILTQERLPHKGETFYADSLLQGPGGKGANQAVQCAKLGLNTTLIGKVGEDRFGEALIGSMRSAGIHTEKIKQKGQSGLGLVNVLYDGDYHSTILKGANYLLDIEDVEREDALFKSADYIILQQEIPAHVNDYVIKKYYENTTIILNNAPARNIEKNILKKLDYLVVNETEAEFMVGKVVSNVKQAFEAAQELYSKIETTIVLTLGKSGVVLNDGKQSFHVPAEEVKAIDTTGAGDSFIGAFVYSLTQGYDLKEAVQFANHVSALTVKNNGGSESFPLLKDCIAADSNKI